jgi:hypothetical protein
VPPALELVTAQATAPGAAFAAMAAVAGNSLTVRNAPDGSMVYLLAAWADFQGAGTLRIRSPGLHDFVQGIRLDVTVSNAQPLLPQGLLQRLFPGDLLTVEAIGSATAGDIETACFLVYYQDLLGISGRFITSDEVRARMRHYASAENTLALGTAGGYSGEETLVTEFDVLHANRDYAVLGYLTDAECAAVRYRGVDTGNLGVGGPGSETDRDVTRDWFMRLSDWTGLPLVPVFNSANRAGILIDGVQDENGTDPTVTTHLALLS